MFSVLGPFQGGYNSIYDISYVCIYLTMWSTQFNAIACRITRHNIFYCASYFIACSYLFTWWASGGLYIFQPAVSADSDYFRSFLLQIFLFHSIFSVWSLHMILTWLRLKIKFSCNPFRLFLTSYCPLFVATLYVTLVCPAKLHFLIFKLSILSFRFFFHRRMNRCKLRCSVAWLWREMTISSRRKINFILLFYFFLDGWSNRWTSIFLNLFSSLCRLFSLLNIIIIMRISSFQYVLIF